MDIYREKLLENYNNPQNYGKEIAANAIMELENVSCGDVIKVKLLIEDKKVKDVSFEGEGCAIAIASTSILTQHIKGKSIEEIKKIDLDELMKLMGVQLTMSRLKCANLGLEAVKGAISQDNV